MYAYVKRPQTNTTAVPGQAASQRLDGRAAATAQHQLQHTASNSRQAMQLRGLQPAAASNVMQRKINVVLESLPQVIAGLVADYNLLGDAAPVGARIDQLSALEHEVYAWLIANKTPDMNAVHQAPAVRRLMQTTKEERSLVVAHSVDIARDHLGQGDIPIAGLSRLRPDEQLEVRAMWRELIEGSGKIKITDTDSDSKAVHANFRMQVLVEFSRLLEGRFGRSIVKDVNASAYQVVIEPFYMADRTNKSLAAAPITGDAENLIKLDVPPAAELRVHYPQTDITNMPEAQRRMLFNQLQPTAARQQGVGIVDAGDVTYYQFGAGSDVKVTVPSDLPDDSQYNDSRLADAEGNELATPVFISLGHELGHAKHMQRGTATKVAPVSGLMQDPPRYRGLSGRPGRVHQYRSQ